MPVGPQPKASKPHRIGRIQWAEYYRQGHVDYGKRVYLSEGSKANTVTFSRVLSRSLQGARVRWGVEESGRIVFEIVTDPEKKGWSLRHSQSTCGGVLIRLGVPRGTYLYFDYDETLGLFVEIDRIHRTDVPRIEKHTRNFYVVDKSEVRED